MPTLSPSNSGHVKGCQLRPFPYGSLTPAVLARAVPFHGCGCHGPELSLLLWEKRALGAGCMALGFLSPQRKEGAV